ncbi:MAG: ABC transporter permease subunit [Acidimicrobiales bacterium]
MTAPVLSYQSQQPDGPSGFGAVVRSEWTKFRSVRGWVIGLVVAALVTLALSVFAASGSSASTCNGGPGGQNQVCGGLPPLPKGPGGEVVSDTYSFLSVPLAGDGSLTVRVTSLTGIEAAGNRIAVAVGGGPRADTEAALAPWAKAGILVTTGSGPVTTGFATPHVATSPAPAYGAVMLTGSHGVRMQYNYSHDVAGPSMPGAHWLRLTRNGDALTGFESSDGTTWTAIASIRLPQLNSSASAVRIGMFVTSPVAVVSGNQGRPSMATATFDDVNLGGASPALDATTVGDTAIYPTLPIASIFSQSGGTFTLTGSGDLAPAVGGGIFGGFGLESILVGAFAGLIVFIVLASGFMTSEYRRGLIGTTIAATPNRDRVLAAKAIVIAAVTFVATVPAVAIALVLGRHQLLAHGNQVFPTRLLTEVRVVAGTGVVFALAAVLALALGTLLRRSAGAVVAGIVVMVVPFIMASALPAGASQWLMRVTPAAGFAIQQTLPRYPQVSALYSPTNGYYPLSPWVGLAVLVAFTAVTLAAAGAVLRRRDV